ncbi:MAG: DUF2752 domain-containing protein [Fimbriimonadales bacterium]|nr:DUF2752 domain-containing protein [Fimbriimonadales bacterium]
MRRAADDPRSGWIRLERGAPRRRLWPQMAAFLAWVAAAAIALWIEPSPEARGSHTQLGLPPCALLAIAHRPCPGCGLTTSVAATLRGRWSEALRAHPFGPPLVALATAAACLALWGWLAGVRVSLATRRMDLAAILFLGAFLLFGAARFLLERT